MKTVKEWCVRCLCDEEWIWFDVKRITCDCGAVLVRDGVNKCHAEVDSTYDMSAAKNQQPGMFQEDMEVAS